jgi:polar amino acid transport system substrate-binding protein
MKMQRSGFSRRGVLGVSLLGAAALALPARAQQGHPRAGQPFVVGCEIGFVPFAFRRPNGEFTGFSIDAAREIGRRLGRPSTEIVDVRFAEAFAGLFAGRFETFVGPVNITQQRAEQMLFSEGYFESGLGFLVARAAPELHALEDFRGKALGVNRGSISDTWCTQNAERYGFTVERYNSNPDAVQAVITNRVFANVTETPVARYIATQQQAVRFGFNVPTGTFLGYPFRRDDEALRDAVDAIVEDMKRDGTYSHIHETYFGVPAEPGSILVTPVPGRGQPNFPGYKAP